MTEQKSSTFCVSFGLVALVLGVVLMLAPSLMAQSASTGAMTGTVTDATGGAVPNTKVTITSEAGQVRTATTEADGVYRFALLAPGKYTLRFEASGFNTEEIGPVMVDVTETAVLNHAMKVGTQTQNVTVEANVETVQTTSSTLGTVVRSQNIVDLPLSTRNFTNLISLSAGAAAGVNNATTLGQGSQNVAVNGSSVNQNNFQQDGISVSMYGGTNSLTNGGNTAQPPIPNPDAIEQFKIQTSTYDASYGRNSGANVNVVTKSGTNAFHGTGFEFFRNTVLNANDFFVKRSQLGATVPQPNKQAALSQNQYGGVIGGPVKKDKLFFFVSVQETWQKNGLASQGSINGIRFAPIPSGNRGTCPAGVLTIAQMQANCDAATQAFVAALGAAICPSNSGTNPGCTNTDPLSKPFANQYNGPAGARSLGVDVNASGNNISPQAIQILQLKLPDGSYYVPGSGTAGYTPKANALVISQPAYYHELQGIGNWDYIINSKHTLSGRYFFLNNPTDAPFSAGGTNAFLPGTPSQTEFGNQVAILKLTSVLTNSLVNEARISYYRNTTTISMPLRYTAAQLGITPLNPGGPFAVMPEIDISGMYKTGYQLQQYQSLFSSQYSAADQISWTHGKHTIRSGFEGTYVRYKWLQPSYQFGAMQADTFADFLLGLPGCSVSCGPGTAAAQAGGPGLVPASYVPLPGGTANNGTAVSNIDQILAPTNLTAPGGLLHYFESGNYSAFVQDDFKINSRLTVNLGLRWEYDRFASDRQGQGTNNWTELIALQQIPGSGCVYNGIKYGFPGAANNVNGCSFAGYSVPPDYDANTWGPLPAGVYVNSRRDPTRSGPPKNNFAPRVGFAWQPFASNRLVVRGGAGYFYDLIPGGNMAPPINQQPPYDIPLNVPTGVANIGSTLAQPFLTTPLGWAPRWANFTTGSSSAYNPGGGQGPISSNLVTPLTYNYNLQVQYEFLPTWVAEIGYVGSHAIHQEVPNPVNAAPLASATNKINCGYDGIATDCITTNTTSNLGNGSDRAPYLGFSNSFHTASSTGGAKFNSLQATVRKTFSHGLTFQAAYTWSRAFVASYVGNPNASFVNNVPVIQQYGINTNYRPQRLVINYSYAIPFGHHNGFVGKIAEGWSVSGLTTFQSGQPLSITDTRGGTVFGQPGAPVVALAQCAADCSNAATPGSVQSKLASYFNSTAFGTVPLASTLTNCLACAGTLWGNAGQGLVRGPNQNNYDMTISKVTKVGGLREDATLQFRAEFFNAFNHPQFSNPGLAVNTAATFGVITSAAVNPRFVQFGLKYAF